MTLEQYLSSDRTATNYYRMSQWQRARHFFAQYREYRHPAILLFVLNLNLSIRRWRFGFEQWQTDYRFHLGPLSLIWCYE